jgi:hypothetical protein
VDDHLKGARGQLLDALATGSILVSVSGPSKSGKTVFVESCVGKSRLVHVTGAGISSAAELWLRVFDLIGTSVERTTTTGKERSGEIAVTGEAEGGIPFVVKGKAGGAASASRTTSTGTSEVAAVDYLQLLIKELGSTDLVIFIDDFHYVPREVQSEVARQIKEAIRNGVAIICASVPYHADDVIRGNPDLRGRISSIDFDYWKTDVLQKIARKGFEELNISYRQPLIEQLAAEAAGSPQLMQQLCLNACFEIGVRERPDDPEDLPDGNEMRDRICRRAVASADYGSIVDRMREGPKTRGSDRKMYQSAFGWQGDVYRLLVKALALDPPMLTFRYQDLMDRIGRTCVGESPSGSSITSAAQHAAKLANDAAGSTIMEWDQEYDVFDLTDPYLLFYLRWSDTLD